MMEVESQTQNVKPLETTHPVGSIEIEELRKEVKGKTLQVYLLLARAKEQDFGDHYCNLSEISNIFFWNIFLYLSSC